MQSCEPLLNQPIWDTYKDKPGRCLLKDVDEQIAKAVRIPLTLRCLASAIMGMILAASRTWPNPCYGKRSESDLQ
jgi:hypothetical protein